MKTLMPKAIELLIIDDGVEDIRLTQEYFKEYKIANPCTFVEDGDEALHFLYQQSKYSPENLPGIIFISISILLRNGDSWLHKINNDKTLKHIKKVVLTTFDGEKENLAADLPIDMYARKPLNVACLLHIIKNSDDLGFTINMDTKVDTLVSS